MTVNDESSKPGDTSFANHFFAPPSPRIRVTIGAGTDPGKVRQNNEDHYLVSRRSRWQEVLATNLPAGTVPTVGDEDFMLLVADGIGGEAFGEVASRRVLQVLWDLSAQATSWLMKVTDVKAQDVGHRANAYMERTEAYLRELAEREPGLIGAGTTLTAAHLMGRDVLIANIGDSRAYVYRAGSCRQITTDHTIGQRLLDAGLDTGHVDRLHHILSNCLSIDSHSTAVPELHFEYLEDGDRLLLCTDGLSDMLTIDQIASTLHRRPDAQAACDALIQKALENGGRDNVTVALAQLEPLETPPEDDSDTVP